MDNSSILINILLYINILSLIIGYILAKLLMGSQSNQDNYTNKKNNNQIVKSNTITIDEKKIVTDIHTANLEKKYESLGSITQTENDINNSINKLKNIKK